MDKVQKIREEVVRMHNLIPVMDGDNISVNYADRICTTLEMYIDSMQEEPVELKEVDLMIHTIVAECCDWLAMNTNLSHDKIEDCRNLMLTVKEEQFKAQKGSDYDR